MTLPTHLIAGLIVGKLTGNYSASIAGAVLVDLDHGFSYAKSNLLFDLKKLLKTVLDERDPYGDQRYIFHNILSPLLVAVVIYFFSPGVALAFFLAHLSHLLLDALDNADFFPLFPSKKINIKGPIGYFSKQEFAFAVFLLFLFILL
jgi:membrane-bound metal-dependent hydrolase YbcI (DUF457 family)